MNHQDGNFKFDINQQGPIIGRRLPVLGCDRRLTVAVELPNAA